MLAYLQATGGDPDHPLRRDVARVLSVNGAVLARRGDPGLAVASANSALAYYTSAAGHSASGRLPVEDGAYLRTAAAVSALFNLVSGRLADGLYAALVIAGNLEPGEARRQLETGIMRVDNLLARSEEGNRPVEDPASIGRRLAEFLVLAVRDAGCSGCLTECLFPVSCPAPAGRTGTCRRRSKTRLDGMRPDLTTRGWPSA